MEDYQKRVVAEKEEIDIKIVKLTGFIFSPKFDSVNEKEQERMDTQLRAMMNYSMCLRERIASFK